MAEYSTSVQCHSVKMLWKLNKKGHAYTGDRGYVLKHLWGGWSHPMNAPHICWHPCHVVPPPGQGWLPLQAVGTGPTGCWSPFLHVCITGHLGLGLPGEAKLFPWENIPQNSWFHFEFCCFGFFYFPSLSMQKVPATAKSADLTCLKKWQERDSSFFQWGKFGGWAWNCSCMWVQGLDVRVAAMTSSRAGAWQNSKQHRRGCLGLTTGHRRVVQGTARLQRWFEENAGRLRSCKASLT